MDISSAPSKGGRDPKKGTNHGPRHGCPDFPHFHTTALRKQPDHQAIPLVTLNVATRISFHPLPFSSLSSPSDRSVPAPSRQLPRRGPESARRDRRAFRNHPLQ